MANSFRVLVPSRDYNVGAMGIAPQSPWPKAKEKYFNRKLEKVK
jgi:hypothetical protein